MQVSIDLKMPLPITVPGLDRFVREVPEGCILLVEGGVDVSKTHFVQRLARGDVEQGRGVHLVTSRSVHDVEVDLERTGGRPEHLSLTALADLGELDPDQDRGRDLFVDSFSFLSLGLTDSDLASWMRRLRTRCHEGRSVAVLAIERGMLGPRAEAITAHLSDGVLQFHHREESEGVVQYLRIPKWMTGEVFTRNIYYTFDGRRLLIDTRKRVV